MSSVFSWVRKASFIPSSLQDEKWVVGHYGYSEEFGVRVRLGKPVNIFKLKSDVVEGFVSKVSEVRVSREKIYSDSVVSVKSCVVCASEDVKFKLNVYGALYSECLCCSHVFVSNPPSKKVLDSFYKSDKSYFSSYTSKKLSDIRIREVVVPKVEYVVSEFERLKGFKPKRILDVGAGGGHFVAAARKLGFEADGVEVSVGGVAFCKENFGFDLFNVDFLGDEVDLSGYDIICFWGVVEHLSDPKSLLFRAKKLLRLDDGLLVVEVPNINSLSSSVQKVFSKSVVRHLDPLGHLNVFSDSSLATLFLLCGFKPVSAWFFGMDVFELLSQLSFNFGVDCFIGLNDFVSSVQADVDSVRFSDSIVLMGVCK